MMRVGDGDAISHVRALLSARWLCWLAGRYDNAIMEAQKQIEACPDGGVTRS